jgi:hypothetical protein
VLGHPLLDIEVLMEVGVHRVVHVRDLLLEDRAVAVREADQRANAVLLGRRALVVVDPRQRPRQPVGLLRRHLLLGRNVAQVAATVTIAARRADRAARIVAAGRGPGRDLAGRSITRRSVADRRIAVRAVRMARIQRRAGFRGLQRGGRHPARRRRR